MTERVKLSRLITSLHTMKLSPQTIWRMPFLKTGKALRDLNALRTLPVYPVFEEGKSNGSDVKLVTRKIA